MRRFVSLVVVMGMAGALVCGGALAAEEAAEAVHYGKNVGEVARPITVKDFDGNSVSTGDLVKNGKVMLVLVNAVCNLCRNEMRALVKYRDKFSEKADVYLVAVDMNLEKAKQSYKEFSKYFRLLHDPDFKIGQSLDIYATPATIILDKGGTILYKGSGFKPEYLKKYMEIL